MAKVNHKTAATGGDSGSLIGQTAWNQDHSVDLSVADVSGLQSELAAISNLLSAETANRAALSAVVSSLQSDQNRISSTLKGVSVKLFSAGGSTTTSVQGLQSAMNAIVDIFSDAFSVGSATKLQVSTLSASVSTEIANRAALSATVSALTSAHNTLSAQHTALSGIVSALQSDQNRLSATVSSLAVGSGSVTSSEFQALSSQVVSLSGVVSAAISDLARLSTTVSSLAVGSGSVTSSEFQALSSQVVSLSGVVSTEIANRAALSATVSTIQADLTSSKPQYASKAVNGNFTTVALANVDSTTMVLSAGNVYVFQYLIMWKSGSTTNGLGLSVTFPGMVNFAGNASIQQGADGNAWYAGSITSSGDKVQALSALTSTANYQAVVEGMCKVSSTGNLILQACSGSADTSVHIISGTTGVLRKLA